MSGTKNPFRLRWPGGKRWLARQLAKSLHASTFADGLTEPFAGGAALFFETVPKVAWLSDTNLDLIATYEGIRDAFTDVFVGVRDLEIDRPTFEMMKSFRPVGPVETAIRTIYLNRTAFGGLWRVNRLGEFNVPFGCRPTTRMPLREELALTASLLDKVSLQVGDFEQTIKASSSGAVYLDPPYAAHEPKRETFVRYTLDGFTFDEQQRVAETANRLARDGRFVIVSNADDPAIASLYSDAEFKLYRVERPSNFAPKSTHRGRSSEIVALSRSVRVVSRGVLSPIRRR